MPTELDKNAVCARLALSQYPRRSQARFTPANDHNPLVLEECPACWGRGHRTVIITGVAWSRDCPACAGSGLTGQVVRYFAEERPALIGADHGGQLTCPACGAAFRLDDPHAWTGLRHRACGQKLLLGA